MPRAKPNKTRFEYDPETGLFFGHKGLTLEPNGKWRDRISADKKRYSLGVFNSLDLALDALNKERQKLHGEYSNEG